MASRKRTDTAAAKPRLLTMSQVVSEYGLSRSSLRDLVHRGVLPVIRFPGGRSWRFERDDIERVLSQCKDRFNPATGDWDKAE